MSSPKLNGKLTQKQQFLDRAEAFLEVLRECDVSEARIEEIKGYIARTPDRRMLHYFVKYHLDNLSPDCVYRAMAKKSISPYFLVFDAASYKIYPFLIKKLMRDRIVRVKTFRGVLFVDAEIGRQIARIAGKMRPPIVDFVLALEEAIRNGMIGTEFNSKHVNEITRSLGFSSLIPQKSKVRTRWMQRYGLLKMVERGCALRPAVFRLENPETLYALAKFCHIVYRMNGERYNVSGESKNHEEHEKLEL